MISLKQAALKLNQRIAATIVSRLPGATLEDGAWAGAMSATLVAGMWPGANPSRIAAKVLARPEFAHLKPRMDRDLARAIRALLASIAKR